ncbi:hypothetical protein WKW50_16410 [Ochrobactrum sp. GPK 3]
MINQLTEEIDALVLGQGKILVWSPKRTYNWEEDNAEGRKLANGLTYFMRKNQAEPALPLVIRAICAEGKMEEGVEVGFFAGLASLSVRGLFG